MEFRSLHFLAHSEQLIDAISRDLALGAYDQTLQVARARNRIQDSPANDAERHL